LFRALEAVAPVAFCAGGATETADVDASLFVEGGEPAGDGLRPEGRHCATFGSVESAGTSPGQVVLANSSLIDHRLRGRCLTERGARSIAPVEVEPGHEVVASVGATPVWTSRRGPDGRCDSVSIFPLELGPGEHLRGRVVSGRFFPLVALLHFLREVCSGVEWKPPPLRAAFILDDPNLQWTSYGYLRYAEAIRNAAVHRYHMAIAMVPMDARVVQPRAARLFRDNRQALSIVMHGNDHVRHELARPSARGEAEVLLAQALRRTAGFETRSGVDVGRVMVPPHGACSEPTLQAMRRFGFEAVCMSRPYPWLPAPPPDFVLAGWHPAEFVAGMPVVPRMHLGHSKEETLFRAYLDQPLIFYGHHEDLADGFGPLEDRAGEVRSLGGARWQSLPEIAASNYATRREGAVLGIRLFSRRARVEVPEDIESVRIEVPRSGEAFQGSSVSVGRAAAPLRARGPWWTARTLPVAEGCKTADIRLADPEPLDAADFVSPDRNLWPIVRRILTQTRDRSLPSVAGTGAAIRGRVRKSGIRG